MSNLLKSSLISLAATILSLMAGFASNIIAARLLGPAGSGKVAYALWVATSAAAIADMGLPQTLLRNAGALSGSGDGWKALVRAALRAFTISLFMVCAAILVYAAMAYAYRDARHAWFWVVTAVLFLSYAISAFSTAIARSRNRFGQTAKSTAIGGALQVPLVLIGAWLLGPTGALFGYIARYLPQALRLGHYVDRNVPASSHALTPAMRSYGRYMWLSDLIEILVLSRVEFLFLGYFFSSTGIGYFAAGLGLAGLIEQVMLQISPALIVSFSDAHAKGDHKALQDAYSRVIRMVALIMLPVSFGGAAIMPDLLPLIFGDAFVPAIPAAATLLAFVWTAGLAVIPWGMIGAAGRSGLLLRVQVVCGVLTVLLLSVAVPLAGLEGAAASRAAITTLTFVLLALTAWRYVGVAVPVAALARNVLAAALCAATAGTAVYILDGSASIIVAIPAGAVVYAFAVRLLGLVEAADGKVLMESLGGKLPGPSRPLVSGLLAFLAPS
jgi:O-antigen/teichoic acid export membrane protein